MSQEEIAERAVVKIKFESDLHRSWTDEEFLRFCELNKPLEFERDKFGNIIAMAPSGIDTSRYNFILNIELGIWNKKNKLGYLFDSSAGFKLPDSSVLAPDASFVRKERYDRLTQDEKEGFGPLCPDFVAEIKSPSDTIKILQKKMEHYIENGAQLGWLFDIKKEKVYIYEPRKDVVIVDGFNTSLGGGDTLHGFQFDLKEFKVS
jgi:Uma2 family endonuclease